MKICDLCKKDKATTGFKLIEKGKALIGVVDLCEKCRKKTQVNDMLLMFNAQEYDTLKENLSDKKLVK